MNRPCIALLTDFGLQDTYVGQMKGVIASINPDAIVVDLTHALPPQQIPAAAAALFESLNAFAPQTIFLTIVDPGVGSTRRAIAAEIGPYKFVCPDNGLLTLILRDHPLRRAVILDQPRWFRSVVSRTFHGRDVFAPVAAAWSLGHDLAELGSPLIAPLIEVPIAECEIIKTESGTGTVRGQIVAIDHFGNLITNVPRTAVPEMASQVRVEFAGQCLEKIERCYADRSPGDCVALFGSSDRLEVAIVNGHAARHFNLSLDDPIVVHWS